MNVFDYVGIWNKSFLCSTKDGWPHVGIGMDVWHNILWQR